MCLELKSSKVGVRTAKRDLIVYKRLKVSDYPTPDSELDGKEFTGIIKGKECKGKLRIDGNIYFCTDDEFLDGSNTSDKHGYMYSWIIDDTVTSMIVDGEQLIKSSYITPYRDFRVKIGNTYTSDLVKNYNEINAGIHSFGSLREAESDGGGAYAKCVIPKGSKYYKGEFSGLTSYASDTLKYIEIVKTVE